MINYCPHCQSELVANKKLAQGIWQCNNCSGRFLILVTTPPKNIKEENENKNNPILPNN